MPKTQKYIKSIVSYAKQMRSDSYHFDYKYAVGQEFVFAVLPLIETPTAAVNNSLYHHHAVVYLVVAIVTVAIVDLPVDLAVGHSCRVQ